MPTYPLRSQFLALIAGLCLPLLSGAPEACAQSDSFDSRSDSSWTRYAPLGAYGATDVFSFPDGGYRIQSGNSPSPQSLGPGRAGSLRSDKVYSDFSVSVDITAFDDSLDQSFGLLARITQPGLGTADGYLFIYRPLLGDFLIDRIDNESGVRIGRGVLKLTAGTKYRFVFSGQGSALTGEVFDLNFLGAPFLSFTAFDDAYSSGVNGLLVTTNANSQLGTGDATFDNYRAVVPEPAAAALLLCGALGCLARRRLR